MKESGCLKFENAKLKEMSVWLVVQMLERMSEGREIESSLDGFKHAETADM